MKLKVNKLNNPLATKRDLITKANTTTVVAAAVAAFVVIFSLVASHALFNRAAYQNRVIGQKKKALQQLDANLEARDSLVTSYKAFAGPSQNIIGGNAAGTGDRDGDNTKIVLDALPSKYDFPALTSSLEKLATAQQLNILNLTGTDDEVAQAGQASSSNPAPMPIEFEIEVQGSYPQVQAFMDNLEHSIRPFKVTKLGILSTDEGLQQTITAQTYYQPEKVLELKTKVVK